MFRIRPSPRLAEQHRRDLTARAEARRLARAVRSSRPVPPVTQWAGETRPATGRGSTANRDAPAAG